MRNTKECSMSYRQSVMYKLTTYLKDLPLQSVSSKKNLQVVDKFRKTCELFLCSKNKRGRVGSHAHVYSLSIKTAHMFFVSPHAHVYSLSIKTAHMFFEICLPPEDSF